MGKMVHATVPAFFHLPGPLHRRLLFSGILAARMTRDDLISLHSIKILDLGLGLNTLNLF